MSSVGGQIIFPHLTMEQGSRNFESKVFIGRGGECTMEWSMPSKHKHEHRQT